MELVNNLLCGAISFCYSLQLMNDIFLLLKGCIRNVICGFPLF